MSNLELIRRNNKMVASGAKIVVGKMKCVKAGTAKYRRQLAKEIRQFRSQIRA